jgi:ribosome-associated translation inhibitor RaiA
MDHSNGQPKTPFISELEMKNVGPEVKSYVYQTIMEFEPFTTPETTVAVVAKDPLKLISQLEANGVDYDRTQLKKMHRICISLTEDGAKIEEEAMHEDIFAAIRQAKDKLLLILSEMQDQAITNQDRTAQINTVLSNGTIH